MVTPVGKLLRKCYNLSHDETEGGPNLTLRELPVGGSAVITSVGGSGALLVFCLLYTPCVAAIASIRRELGRNWAVGVAIFQCVVAWLTAAAVALIGHLIG